MTKSKKYKVPLINVMAGNTLCGYGEGRTHAEAVEDALRRGRERDPDAYHVGGQVHFAETLYC